MSMAGESFSVLPAEQRTLLLHMNEVTGRIPPGTLDEAVALLAAERGDALAVQGSRQRRSRADLLTAADRLAAALSGQAVAAGDRVALCVEPGADQVTGLLGILRAGAVPVPVDPGGPQVTRWRQLDRDGITVCVSQSWLLDRLSWPDGIARTALDGVPEAEPAAPPRRDQRDPAVLLPGDDADAAVAISHRELLNMAADLTDRFGLGPDDRMMALAPITTGQGIRESCLALLSGATLIHGQDIDLREPTAWIDLLVQEHLTVWNSTPTLLDLLLTELERRGDRLPGHLRLVLLNGEPLTGALVRRLRGLSGPDLVVANLSAAQEHGAWATCCALSAQEADTPSVPIGGPMRNQRIHVLAENGGICPVWVTGQVHYGGLAAESARHHCDTGPDRWATHPESGEPLLRSPWFGRVLPSGTVETVGHASAQLLVHGRRLHVHDTEVALAAMDGVRAAAVVTLTAESALGFVRLAPGTSRTGQELLDQLRRKVSPYLLPSRIEVLDAFPLTPDGRVDRGRLTTTGSPVPEPVADRQPAVAGGDTLVAAATEIACRVLGVSEIEPDMNLIDFGATSVELVRLATVIEEELGIDVQVEELLRFPSIAVMIGPHLAKTTGPAGESRHEPLDQLPDEPPTAVVPPPADGGLLVDLVARQAFKDAHHGIRQEYDAVSGIALGREADPRVPARRSHRRFAPGPVAFTGLAALLGAVRRIQHAGETKYWYPSAGGAYPLGVYADVAPDRVTGLDAGTYYVHPGRAELVPVRTGQGVPPAAHAEINHGALRQSAFVLYLISRMDAISPLYGELAGDFSVFEAGAMAQLLMMVAAENGLGLCPVGTVDTAALREPLRLRPDDRFVHALLGGVPDVTGERTGSRRVPDIGDRLGRAARSEGERP
ncbi:AMP-binding protein [Streptomyces pinistramenti]|uniref:AMP-binding protein n=1 Tax=Streptomyces pinistramenti TaxID=2884812 RepID=UPI001D096399|nr:AMP-binding protein [Streptomyces pinistramenti]MCB5909702.1 AMP-binding protein [Streptomyces pinistramenti]